MWKGRDQAARGQKEALASGHAEAVPGRPIDPDTHLSPPSWWAALSHFFAIQSPCTYIQGMETFTYQAEALRGHPFLLLPSFPG